MREEGDWSPNVPARLSISRLQADRSDLTPESGISGSDGGDWTPQVMLTSSPQPPSRRTTPQRSPTGDSPKSPHS
eukprot:CAMPEP_0169447096 /NCGR_PEP_ID=MMETSP1042-20121227/11336_1 /TAXON_ID=464988 /ORGANISM="Hemiselmis andersenii, Strain CCMP1180" /LENGTH=74 /DNA_ID=CAMNT_0009558627 /DNA_START=290 /DNA_END=511 /DNA_ORIENTATION=-